jgi:hypothetical protein
VAILSFYDIFLIDNGPLADSFKKWAIPKIFNVHHVLKNGLFLSKMADSYKKYPIPRNRPGESANSKSPLFAV